MKNKTAKHFQFYHFAIAEGLTSFNKDYSAIFPREKKKEKKKVK